MDAPDGRSEPDEGERFARTWRGSTLRDRPHTGTLPSQNAGIEDPQILEMRALEKWNGTLPQVTGGAVPFISLPPASAGAGKAAR